MRKKSRASGFSRLAAVHWRMKGVRSAELFSNGSEFRSPGGLSSIGEAVGVPGWSWSRITLLSSLTRPADRPVAAVARGCCGREEQTRAAWFLTTHFDDGLPGTDFPPQPTMASCQALAWLLAASSVANSIST